MGESRSACTQAHLSSTPGLLLEISGLSLASKTSRHKPVNLSSNQLKLLYSKCLYPGGEGSYQAANERDTSRRKTETQVAHGQFRDNLSTDIPSAIKAAMKPILSTQGKMRIIGCNHRYG